VVHRHPSAGSIVGCCRVYFIRNKSEVFDKFREFESCVTNECGNSIATLRTDNGGEYLSNDFETYLKSKEYTMS